MVQPPGPALGGELAAKVPLRVPEHGRPLKVLAPDGGLLLQGGLPGLVLQAPEGGRRLQLPHADPGGGLVHQVHRLVGQEAVRQIPDR